MPILAYHSVDARWNHPLAVQPEMLAKQIAAVKHRIIQLSEYVRRFENRELTGTEVALTFDDGYEDFFVSAVPILKTIGASATVFIPSGLVGEQPNAAVGGTTKRLLSWDELRELVRLGMSIGSHSLSHADLRGLSGLELEREVAGSRRDLQEHLGEQVDFFCYPGGRYLRETVEAVARAGYRAALVTPTWIWGPQSRFTLRRMGIYRHDDMRRFRLKVSRAGQLARWVRLAARGPY